MFGNFLDKEIPIANNSCFKTISNQKFIILGVLFQILDT